MSTVPATGAATAVAGINGSSCQEPRPPAAWATRVQVSSATRDAVVVAVMPSSMVGSPTVSVRSVADPPPSRVTSAGSRAPRPTGRSTRRAATTSPWPGPDHTSRTVGSAMARASASRVRCSHGKSATRATSAVSASRPVRRPAHATAAISSTAATSTTHARSTLPSAPAYARRAAGAAATWGRTSRYGAAVSARAATRTSPPTSQASSAASSGPHQSAK